MTITTRQSKHRHDGPFAWMDSAACAGTDPEVFFVTRGRSDLREEATSICRICPVRTECLDFANRTEVPSYRHGIYGGQTSDERAAIARDPQPIEQ